MLTKAKIQYVRVNFVSFEKKTPIVSCMLDWVLYYKHHIYEGIPCNMMAEDNFSHCIYYNMILHHS